MLCLQLLYRKMPTKFIFLLVFDISDNVNPAYEKINYNKNIYLRKNIIEE